MKLGRCLWVADTKALTSSEFRALFNAALDNIPSRKAELGAAKIGLAVSGGADSMALAALAAEALGPDRVIGLVVDHKLGHMGTSENPAQVQTMLSSIGVKSDVLTLSWKRTAEEPSGDGETSNQRQMLKGHMMLLAREERYKAFMEACRRHNAPLLLTGHNLEDDIVTMLYRISRLSGLDGLAGMKLASTFPFPAPQSDAFFIVRPLLTTPKARLMQTCQDRGIAWLHDTSNDDLNFRRNELLESLVKMQEENPAVSTEALVRSLNSFKKHRRHVHQEVTNVLAKSVILNRTVGDATLILNDPALVSKNYLFNRVLTFLTQFATSNAYPPKTATLNRVFDALRQEYLNYCEERRRDSRNAQRYVQTALSPAQHQVKRIALSQHTLAGATVYALARNDTSRRLANFSHQFGKQLSPGPALLIMREAPSKKELAAMAVMSHDFGDGKPYLWDDRIFIECRRQGDRSGDLSLQFTIRPLSQETVKEFEEATRKNAHARRNLYNYLATTPFSHLHLIPVMRHEASGYMALPTLSCYSDPTLFHCTTYNTAAGAVIGKILCLP